MYSFEILKIEKLELSDSKKIEFNEEVVKNYFNKTINLNSKQFDNSLLKEPFFFK